MSAIRVAHVITRLCTGGAQENTLHTIRLANRTRFEPVLISGRVGSDETSMEESVHAAGINIIRVPSLVRRVAPWSDFRTLRRLTALFRARGYHIVHTHTSKAGFLGRLAASRARVPIVVHTPHGNIFQGYFPKPITRMFIGMERYAATFTDRIITLTPGGTEEHLAQKIGRREQYESIFSGVDFSPYPAAIRDREETRRTLGIAPDALLVGGVGRLEPVKGFAYFVRAAHTIAEAVPKAQFMLVGDGTLGPQLRNQAETLGERFRFMGQRDDVPQLMAAMDVLVLPSLNEGMGRVLLESGAAATPAVATAVGGVSDILGHGQLGVLVPPRDAGMMAKAVIELLRDPHRRKALGQDARASIVPGYGIERMVQCIEELYEKLIKEKGLDT